MPSSIAITGFLSTVDPAVTDDGAHGHYVFERWYNITSGAEFICKDKSTGAAVWTPVGGGTITDWASEATTITATTTSPTKGTIARDKIYWRRVGDSMEIRLDYKQTSSGSAGSGTYLFALPTGAGGVTIDSTKIPFITTAGLFGGAPGNGAISDETTFSHPVEAVAYDTTHFKLLDYAVGDVGSGGGSFSASTMTYNVRLVLPITEWA